MDRLADLKPRIDTNGQSRDHDAREVAIKERQCLVRRQNWVLLGSHRSTCLIKVYSIPALFAAHKIAASKLVMADWNRRSLATPHNCYRWHVGVEIGEIEDPEIR